MAVAGRSALQYRVFNGLRKTSHFYPTNSRYLLVSALTTVPAITYGAGVAVSAQGQNPTTDSNGGSFNPAYFGPNFEIATAVPEPASLTIFGTALAGLGVMRRRRRRKDV